MITDSDLSKIFQIIQAIAVFLFHFSKGKRDRQTQTHIFEFFSETSKILAEYLKIIISRF